MTARPAELRFCAQCGLPVASGRAAADSLLYCCHACRLVSRIVGPGGDTEQAWGLLRLGIGTLFAMNIMMISLLFYTGSVDSGLAATFRFLLLILSAAALLVLLPPFIFSAWGEARGGKPGLDLLIAGGSCAAFGVSAVNTASGSGEIYFDTATMLPVLVTFGKLIEGSAKRRAADLLHSLEGLIPLTAWRIRADGEGEVNVGELLPGDLVRIRPGERVPVDGQIVQGHTLIAEAAFTGEHFPRPAGPGDAVIAGTVNGEGVLVVRTVKTAGDLFLHRVVQMVRRAWENKSGVERLAERAAALFIPLVVTAFLLLLAGWWLAGDPMRGMLSGLSLLVVACPCSMGIAAPLATSLAIARAAMAGVVVRGGAAMEGVAGIDMVIFDKTGTVTDRAPLLQQIVLADGTDEEELLGRLATLESASEHPLAEAIVAEARRQGIEVGRVEQVKVVPGEGISGEVIWHGLRERVTARSGFGAVTSVVVSWGGRVRGTLIFAENIRPGVRCSVTLLEAMGIGTMLASGDRQESAASIGAKVGITRVAAPCTPEGKLALVRRQMAAGKKVAVVGDGINDAPALAAASCGIAVGGGTELARQAGEVIILGDRLDRLPWLIRLGRSTGRIIRWNLGWSFGYNSLALAVAAAGLLHPLLAAVAMICSSLTVLGNSVRIRSFPDPVEVEP